MSGRGETGVTLLELLVTVAIITLVSSMGMVAMPAMIDSYRLRQAAGAVAGAVREAQIRAVREGRFWRVVMDADGGGYTVNTAASTIANPGDCATAIGWSSWRSPYRWHSSVRIKPGGMSRPCLTFGPTGRAEWPTPEILIQPGDPVPRFGEGVLPRLTDGVAVLPPKLPLTLFESDTVVYWQDKATAHITVDVHEVRYFSAFCIGLPAYRSKYSYPRSVTVSAAGGETLPADPSGWTTLPNLPPAPVIPAGQTQDRQCMNIPVNGSYRFFRVSLTPELSKRFIVLDEVNADTLVYTLTGPKKAMQLQVSPVTGHVQVFNVGS